MSLGVSRYQCCRANKRLSIAVPGTPSWSRCPRRQETKYPGAAASLGERDGTMAPRWCAAGMNEVGGILYAFAMNTSRRKIA
jgi:hypothetical protein